jgi:hypothetical protein
LASEALTAVHVRHVVIGDVAVVANGCLRPIERIQFLIGGEAFVRHASGLVTSRVDLPFQVNGVAVDFRSPGDDEGFLEEALAAPPGSVIDAPARVYLKLKSPRRKDEADVIELAKAGIDLEACRSYLSAHAPELVAAFEQAIQRASVEED